MSSTELNPSVLETINNILSELENFKLEKIPNLILTGSVALYLFLYSLFIDPKYQDKMGIIIEQLNKLPVPKDIDIIGSMCIKRLKNYIKAKNNSEVKIEGKCKGIKVKHKTNSYFPIDIIIGKPNYQTLDIKITKDDGSTLQYTIIHPKDLLQYIYRENKEISGEEAVASNEIQQQKKYEYSIKHSVLLELDTQGLLPPKAENNSSRLKIRSRINPLKTLNPPRFSSLKRTKTSSSNSNSSISSITRKKSRKPKSPASSPRTPKSPASSPRTHNTLRQRLFF